MQSRDPNGDALTKAFVEAFAQDWVAAWNAHDLDRIMEHYAADVELVSPVAARLLGDAAGRVRGKDALRAYFKKGLAVYPDLHFELVDVMWGIHSVVLYYTNQSGTKSGEYMEFDPTGHVIRVAANYGDR
jgi:ketosteroid isomerase-like protein